jgi:hypothetical protein
MKRPSGGLSVVAYLCIGVASGGCGGGATPPANAGTRGHTAGPSVGTELVASRLSIGKAAAGDRRAVACMHRNGMTVLSSGAVQTRKAVTPAAIGLAEEMCDVRLAGPGRTKLEAEATARRAERAAQGSEHRVVKMAACLRRDGVAVSLTQASSVLSSSIKRASPRVMAAIGKCRSESLTAVSR